MGDVRRWIVGLATLWPPAYFLLFVAVVGAPAIAGGGAVDGRLLISDEVLFALQIATTLVIAGLLGLCLHHVHRSPELRPRRRMAWVVMLFVGSAVAMPVYWWLYMRPDSDARMAHE